MENLTKSETFRSDVGAITADVVGAVLAIVLNTLNLIVLAGNHVLLNKTFRMCLQVLSVVDILGGIACYGTHILYVRLSPILAKSVSRCNVVVCSCVSAVMSSQMILFVLTIERYIAVTRPLRFNAIITTRRTQILLAAAIALSILLSSLRSMNIALKHRCEFDIDGTLFTDYPLLSLYNAVPFLLLVVTTVINMHLLYIAQRHKHQENIARQTNFPLQPNENERAHKVNSASSITKRLLPHKSIITVSVVVGGNYMMWAPYLMLILATMVTKEPTSRTAIYATTWVVYTGHWLTPVVLFALSKSYRNAVRTVFSKRGHPKP